MPGRPPEANSCSGPPSTDTRMTTDSNPGAAQVIVVAVPPDRTGFGYADRLPRALPGPTDRAATVPSSIELPGGGSAREHAANARSRTASARAVRGRVTEPLGQQVDRGRRPGGRIAVGQQLGNPDRHHVEREGLRR